MVEKSAPVKKVAKHPTYAAMIASALTALKSRKGSSKVAVEKFIRANYEVAATANGPLKLALKKGVESGAFVQVKGKGANGSFKLGKVAKPAVKKVAVKKVIKKPVVKKIAPKPSGKMIKKKAVAKKPAKKVLKKTVAKKVLKPVAKKAPKPAAKKAKK